METNLNILLNYYDYSESIRSSINSKKLIERMKKGSLRVIKIVDSLPSEESAKKMIYLMVTKINKLFSRIILKRFYRYTSK